MAEQYPELAPGAFIVGEEFHDIKIMKRNLAGASLANTTFTGFVFHADARIATFIHCRFQGIYLGGHFDGSVFIQTSIIQCKVGIILTRARLRATTWENCDSVGIVGVGTELASVSFNKCTIEKGDFSDCDAHAIRFESVNADELTFLRSRMHGAFFFRGNSQGYF